MPYKVTPDVLSSSENIYSTAVFPDSISLSYGYARNKIIRKQISALANVKETYYSNCCWEIRTGIESVLCQKKQQNTIYQCFQLKVAT